MDDPHRHDFRDYAKASKNDIKGDSGCFAVIECQNGILEKRDGEFVIKAAYVGADIVPCDCPICPMRKYWAESCALRCSDNLDDRRKWRVDWEELKRQKEAKLNQMDEAEDAMDEDAESMTGHAFDEEEEDP